jgi:glycosyltransferase involved in cell wall biosynthesis
MPRFSVLIPTIGRTELVRDSLKSILDQNFNDVETIIADSGSSDELRKLVEEADDVRIRYVGVPGGDPSLGWDYAYKQARGEYVLWLDDDNELLPFALGKFDTLIRKTAAEIVTASHVYYYNRFYIRSDRRNALGIIPFDRGEGPIEPREAVKALLSFSLGGKIFPYRLHPAATMFSKVLCERSVARTGYVVLPGMRVNHSLQVLLFGQAKSCYGVRSPFSVVGRYGSSLTQSFNTRVKASGRKIYRFELSPIKSDLLRNHVWESYLRARALLPEIMDIPPNTSRFLELYLRDLFFADQKKEISAACWRELLGLIVNHPDIKDHDVFLGIAKRYCLYSNFVQPLKNMGLWMWFKNIFRRSRIFFGVEDNRKFGMSSEFIVPLKKYYINDVAELLPRIPEIVKKEINIEVPVS